jgi:uroporphyrinogen III methyltransferase/synthase
MSRRADEAHGRPGEVRSGKVRSGKVWLVGAGPGEPDLITVRGRELLGQAEVVLFDALSHPDLLEYCPQAEQIDVGKKYGERATPQEHITGLLVELARAGRQVVRLKGGDPLVFARGSEEALALVDAGIPFEIVPGITSPIGAAAFAGISLTHRDLSSSVTFITGSDQAGKEWSPAAWEKLATATGTICVLMGMRRLDEITRAIMQGGRAPSTPVAVVNWGARPEQRTVEGTLDTIAQLAKSAGLSSPSIVIVGEVVALRRVMRWYDTKPLFGKRILVARPHQQAAATCRAVRERGARAVVHPALVIAPPPDADAFREAVLAAGCYDWVVFTSANGVEKAGEVLRASERDARVFAGARIAVIGDKTGQALGSLGLLPDLVAPEFVAESLLEELLARTREGERILLLRAREAREVLPEGLAGAGRHVDVVFAYETRSVEGDELEALRRAVVDEVDVVLFTSSSMVHSVVAALGPTTAKFLAKATVLSIGPVTSASCREHGIRVDVEADVHTVSGALDALETWYASASR